MPCSAGSAAHCMRQARHRGQRGQAHLAQRLCPPRGSGAAVSRRRGRGARCHYLSAPLTRIHDIVLVAVLVEQRLRVAARRRVHGGRARRGRAQSGGGEGRWWWWCLWRVCERTGGASWWWSSGGELQLARAAGLSVNGWRTGGDAGQMEVRTCWLQRAWRQQQQQQQCTRGGDSNSSSEQRAPPVGSALGA